MEYCCTSSISGFCAAGTAKHWQYFVHWYILPFFLPINPFRTAVSFWVQTAHISSSLSPKRDCGPRRVDHRLFFSLSPSRISDPGPHNRLSSPLSTTARAFTFIASRLFSPSSLVDSRRVLAEPKYFQYVQHARSMKYTSTVCAPFR